MSQRLNSKGFHAPSSHADDRCIGCRQCVDMCPEAAIEIDKEDVLAPNGQEPSAGDTQ